MKKFLVIVLVLMFVFSGISFAKKTASYSANYKGSKNFGFGIVFGGTQGGLNAALSAKKWLDRTSAIQGDLNWDFNFGAIGVGVAYLMHNFDAIKIDNAKMPLYFGIKGWAAFYSGGAGIGIQVPLGLVWIPKGAPVDVFVQIEPGIMIVPATAFAGSGGLGVRYWF